MRKSIRRRSNHVFISFFKGFALAAFCFCFLSTRGGDCPCPAECGPCQGGLINLTLIYNGQAEIDIEGWDRNFRVVNSNFEKGDTIRVSGSLPNSRFRGDELRLVIDGDEEIVLAVTCSAFEVYKSVGPFVMIAAESFVGGAVCCPAVLQYDVVAPQFLTQPKNIEVDLVSGCSIPVTWTNPDATDCSTFTVSSNPLPGSEFEIGETSVVVSAVDGRNNTSTTTFTVFVRDVSAPVFSKCPDDIELTTADPDGILVKWDSPRAIDNCGGTTLESNFAPGAVFVPGTHTVKYSARDGSGNVSYCSFKVSVQYAPPGEEPLPPIGDIIASKLITPDGDGINDVFVISNIENFQSNKVTIFDRWGNTVSEFNNYDNADTAWSGTGRDSRKLPTGTYFFSIVVYTSDRKTELRGFIELIN